MIESYISCYGLRICYNKFCLLDLGNCSLIFVGIRILLILSEIEKIYFIVQIKFYRFNCEHIDMPFKLFK
jgi:hypothetical protein